jgi:hypothetical protein
MDLAPFTFPDDMTMEDYEFYRPARHLPQYMPPGEDKIEASTPLDASSQNVSL